MWTHNSAVELAQNASDTKEIIAKEILTIKWMDDSVDNKKKSRKKSKSGYYYNWILWNKVCPGNYNGYYKWKQS